MPAETRRPGTTGARAWCAAVGALVWAAAVAVDAGPIAAGAAGDDLTFRPTVIVRKGTGQGSGTIIASVDGETLVLTAAHVVRGAGLLGVEFHRYNMGVEQAVPRDGWPVTVAAEVAAADAAADVAVVRVRGRPAFPYVARLGAPGDEPARDAAVTSVGVDDGSRLKSWSTRVRDVVWLTLVPLREKAAAGKETRDGGRGEPAPDGTRFQPADQARVVAAIRKGERPFLVTARAPVPGRSGGGLFLEGGRPTLIGVCVGRIELDGGKALGVFASGESVRRLLRENDLDTFVARSEAARARRNPPGGSTTGGH